VPDLRWKAALLAAPLAALAFAWMQQAPRNWLLGFVVTALILPPLPVALGSSGPHVCLFFAAFGILAGAAFRRAWAVPRDASGRALLLFLATLLLSLAPAAILSGATIAGASLARVVLFGIAVYLYLYLTCGPGAGGLAGSQREIRLVLYAGAASALLACVDFYFQFPAPAGYGPQFVWLDSGVYRRAQGVFYEASTLGNLCTFCLTGIAACALTRRGYAPLGRAATALCSAACLAALVLSYSRGSLVALGISLAVLVLMDRGVGRSRVLASSAVLAAVAASSAWLLLPDFVQLYWQRLQASAEYFFSAPEGVLSGRLDSWHQLASFLAANPWHAVAGIGYKTLPYTDVAGRPVIADNMYLSALVETGAAGLLALLFLNGAVLRDSYRASRRSDPGAALCGKWFFAFWCGEIVQMASGDLLTYWRVLPLYFWVLAMAVHGSHEHPVHRSIQ
jgi:O-antigen ligase